MSKPIYSLALLACVFTKAMLSPQAFTAYQEAFREANGYLVQNGDQVSVLIPVSVLYEKQTTYMKPKAEAVTKVLSQLIQASDGKVKLTGLLDRSRKDLVFAQSALYGQIAHLSEYLLQQVSDVSYAPVTVDAYLKNKNYRIWDIYPHEDVFVSISLRVD